jgi:hypothetical protein
MPDYPGINPPARRCEHQIPPLRKQPGGGVYAGERFGQIVVMDYIPDWGSVHAVYYRAPPARCADNFVAATARRDEIGKVAETSGGHVEDSRHLHVAQFSLPAALPNVLAIALECHHGAGLP